MSSRTRDPQGQPHSLSHPSPSSLRPAGGGPCSFPEQSVFPRFQRGLVVHTNTFLLAVNVR